MKKEREFDTILDECLERLLMEGETVEQCLSRHPEYAAELEPLLRTALVSKEAVDIKPRPEFRERASYQFQTALREMETKKSRGLFGWQPRWAITAVAVVVLLLAGSGTVAAAGNSLPDEPLYQVKLATEAVRLALTPSALGKAELYVKLADKRVDEIIRMADEGKVEQVEKTTEKLDDYLVAMASLTAPGGEGVMDSQVATFGTEQPPVTVEEAPQDEVSEVPRAQEEEAPAAVQQAPAAAEKAPVVTAPKAPGPPEKAVPAEGENKVEGIELDEQAELKKDVSQHAVENQKALQAVLARVPESVKPALEKAIEVVNTGYERALESLD